MHFLRFDIDKLDAHMTEFSLLGIRHVEAGVLDIRALLAECKAMPAKRRLDEVAEVFKTPSKADQEGGSDVPAKANDKAR